MFEKEAEEYTENPKSAWKQGMTCVGSVRQAFKDGAEFGYNKANEWHFVKDEFPPENVPLNIITFDKDKKRRLWEGEYKGGNGQWWTGYFNHFIDVPYAWKEIVLPEEG
jgi:hypothetical protein